MAITAAVGQAFTLEGRDAATDAVHEALRNFEGKRISLAIVFASHEYDIQEVLNGITTQLGNTPLVGMSTYGEIVSTGSHRRSVVVALLSGEDMEVQTAWVPGFSENSLRSVEALTEALNLHNNDKGALFVIGDGLNGDGAVICKNLPLGGYQLAGCLAGGDLNTGRTYQLLREIRARMRGEGQAPEAVEGPRDQQGSDIVPVNKKGSRDHRLLYPDDAE